MRQHGSAVVWADAVGQVSLVAQYVLALNVVQRVYEYWLPARHGTGDQSPASMWQRDSNTLATEGMAVAFRSGLPWLEVLSLWDDAPEPLWCAGSVFLSPSLLWERQYVIACGEASPLAQFVGESGIDCHIPRPGEG